MTGTTPPTGLPPILTGLADPTGGDPRLRELLARMDAIRRVEQEAKATLATDGDAA